MRAVVGGSALGFAAGWNVSNTGAVAVELGDSYGVGLAVVGLFTTALFLAHLAMQIPGGKASDRFGPRRVGLAGLVIIAAANAVALRRPGGGGAIGARTLAGVGLGLVFLAGSAYVREQGGSPAAQGVFGGIALAGGGAALVAVPQLEEWIGWRAPYATAIAVALVALLCLAAGPRDPARGRTASTRGRGIVTERRLYRLAVVFAAGSASRL